MDACHLLKDQERVVVNCCKSKDCEKVQRVMGNLHKLNMTEVDLPKGSRILSLALNNMQNLTLLVGLYLMDMSK